MASPASPKLPGLLRLPVEIRLEIYRHLVKQRPADHPFDGLAITSAAYTFDPGVLHLNKQIASEAKRVFYAENTWKVIVSYNFNYFRLLNGLAALRQQSFLPHMRRFHLRFDLCNKVLKEYPSFGLTEYCLQTKLNAEKTCRVLAALPALQVVEISWVDDTQGGSWEQKRWILDSLVLLQAVSFFEVRDVLVQDDAGRARELIADYVRGITSSPSFGAGRNVTVSAGSSSATLNECVEDYVAYLAESYTTSSRSASWCILVRKLQYSNQWNLRWAESLLNIGRQSRTGIIPPHLPEIPAQLQQCLCRCREELHAPCKPCVRSTLYSCMTSSPSAAPSPHNPSNLNSFAHSLTISFRSPISSAASAGLLASAARMTGASAHP